jgi:hypothetical protein
MCGGANRSSPVISTVGTSTPSATASSAISSMIASTIMMIMTPKVSATTMVASTSSASMLIVALLNATDVARLVTIIGFNNFGKKIDCHRKVILVVNINMYHLFSTFEFWIGDLCK